MATLAISALGAMGGSALGIGFLGMTGAQVGWMAGSIVGSLLFPPQGVDSEGPRLSDLSVQSGAFGQPIPKVYGTSRIAGNVLWSLPIIEKKKKEKAGGKGGGGSSYTTYTYFATFAVGICQGELEGIRRIWADANLIYDASDPLEPIKQDESINGLRIYLGDRSQTSNSTMEADKGAGNVPGYRNLAYVVFERLALEKSGNRIPSLTFEVVGKKAALTCYPWYMSKKFPTVAHARPGDTSGDNLTAAQAKLYSFGTQVCDYDETNGIIYCVNDENLFTVDVNSGSVTILKSKSDYDSIRHGRCTHLAPVKNSREPYVAYASWGEWAGVTWSWDEGCYNHNCKALSWGSANMWLEDDQMFIGGDTFRETGFLQFSRYIGAWYRNAPGKPIWTFILGHGDGTEMTHEVLNSFDSGTPVPSVFMTPDTGYARTGAWITGIGYWDDYVIFSAFYGYNPGSFSRACRVFMINRFNGPYHPTDNPNGYTQLLNGTNPDDGTELRWVRTRSNTTVNMDLAVVVNPDDGHLLVMGREYFIRPRNAADADPETAGFECIMIDQAVDADPPEPQPVFYYNNTKNCMYTQFNTLTNHTTPVALNDQGYTTGIRQGWFRGNTAIGHFATRIAFSTSPPDFSYIITKNPTGFNVEDVWLQDVVEDLLSRSGLKANQYDCSALIGIPITGYVLSRPMTIRAALDPLLVFGNFDIIESDGILKCVLRGNLSGVRVFENDMAASEDVRNEDQPVVITRTQELDLPREVSLAYNDINTDYEIGVQKANRLITVSENERSMQLPIVMTATKAKQLSEIVQLSSWSSRVKYSFMLPLKYLYLEPSDVIEIDADGSVHLVYITSITVSGGLLAVDGIMEDAENYVSEATGTEGETNNSNDIQNRQPAAMIPMNLPLLTSRENQFGFYSAVASNPLNFPGAGIFQSNNAADFVELDPTFDSLGTHGFITAVNVGASTTNVKTPHLIDYASKLTVFLSNGQLESVSDEDFFKLNRNIAIIGSPGSYEIIAFKNATLTAANTYDVDTIIHGLCGTQNNLENPNLQNSRFIVADNATLRFIPDAVGMKDVLQHFKAVTYGTEIDAAPAVAFSDQGSTLKPLSPVKIQYYVKDNDLYISWVRRTRFDYEWKDEIDVPLLEAREFYEIDIVDTTDETIIYRTITALQPGCIYEQAAQVTDGAPATFKIKIYQVSDIVGRGYEASVLYS